MTNTFRSKQFKRTKNKQSYIKRLYCRYAYEAKVRDLEFDLSFELFKELIFKNCYLCNSPPTNVLRRKGRDGMLVYNGIDRVDSNLGYIKTNVKTCCKKCNYIKKDFSLKELKSQIKKIVKFSIPISFGKKK